MDNKLVITTEIRPKEFYPIDALNLLDGIECEVVDNIAIISVDTTKYNTAQSIFYLGRFVELRIANEQLKVANKLIQMLTGDIKELKDTLKG